MEYAGGFTIAASVLAILICGCAKNARNDTAKASAASDTALASSSGVASGAADPTGGRRANRASVLRGGDIGLELVRVSSALSPRDFAAAMLPYTQEPVPISAPMIATLQANGFRAVSVPIADVDRFASSLAVVGAGESQWLGQITLWTELVKAPDRVAQTVALDAERLELPAGRFRLLGRAWLEPVDPSQQGGGAADGRARAALRVELLPQHQESVQRMEGVDPTLRLTEPTLRTETQGLSFSRLAMSVSLPPGRALVLVPEMPGVDWRRAAAAAPEPSEIATGDEQAIDAERGGGLMEGGSGTLGPGQVSRIEPGRSERAAAPRDDSLRQSVREEAMVGAGGGAADVVGPRSVAFLTVGQALLAPPAPGPVAAPTVKAGEGARVLPEKRAMRTVLVFVPMVPERYELLQD